MKNLYSQTSSEMSFSRMGLTPKLTDEEMDEVAKLDKDERYYHRTEEQLKQFAGWRPDFEK